MCSIIEEKVCHVFGGLFGARDILGRLKMELPHSRAHTLSDSYIHVNSRSK